MNQKQKDYLIKRLVTAKEKKVSEIKFPDFSNAIIKMVKKVTDKRILELVHKEIDKQVRTSVGNFTNGYHAEIKIDLRRLIGNYQECDKEYDKKRSSNNKLRIERTEKITNKFDEVCDKIMFAENYSEAIKLFEEFNKF